MADHKNATILALEKRQLIEALEYYAEMSVVEYGFSGHVAQEALRLTKRSIEDAKKSRARIRAQAFEEAANKVSPVVSEAMAIIYLNKNDVIESNIESHLAKMFRDMAEAERKEAGDD